MNNTKQWAAHVNYIRSLSQDVRTCTWERLHGIMCLVNISTALEKLVASLEVPPLSCHVERARAVVLVSLANYQQTAKTRHRQGSEDQQANRYTHATAFLWAIADESR